MATRGPYLEYLHLFRGAAILQIVAVHAGEGYLEAALPPGAASEQQPGVALFETLFHDATLYFALISGVLYAHVFAARGVAAFYRSRLQSVVLPYLLLSTLLLIGEALIGSGWSLRAAERGVADWPHLLLNWAWAMRLGSAWFHLWYMPVVIGLYAVSPLLYRVVTDRRWRWLVAALTALPLVVSRTGNYPGASTFFYFVGAYTLGMVIGGDAERILDRVARHVRVFAIVGALASALLLYMFLNNIDDFGRVSLQETVFYVQKLALAGLIVTALRRWEARENRARDLILGSAASWAFAIYFLHAPIMRGIAAVLARVMPALEAWWSLAIGCVVTYGLTLLATAGAIAIVRLAFGKRSRFVMGA